MLYNDTRIIEIDLSVYKKRTMRLTHDQYKSIRLKAQDMFYVITDVENLAYLGNFPIDLHVPLPKRRDISDHRLDEHLDKSIRAFVMGNSSLHNVIIGIMSLYTDVNNIGFQDMLTMLRCPKNNNRQCDISPHTKEILFRIMKQPKQTTIYYRFYNTIYNEFLIADFLPEEIRLFKAGEEFDVTDIFQLLQFRIKHLLNNLLNEERVCNDTQGKVHDSTHNNSD